tara:strand:+ start:169 stop:483 length:315 start_codon:yes stop_codon:yes gene_type:complete
MDKPRIEDMTDKYEVLNPDGSFRCYGSKTFDKLWKDWEKWSKESEPKEYTVSFIPFDALHYDYLVEAKDEDEAYEKGKQELRWAIGYDASKDWECSDIKEMPDE